MITEATLLSVVEAYSSGKGWKEATASSRIFNDGKKVSQLRAGASITISRLNDALRFMSDDWPEGVEWPSDVTRPDNKDLVGQDAA